ncbi:hypothetical protein D3C72_1254610 [compost metagenome]
MSTAVNKFDRILQRKDMPPLVLIDVVNHCRQGGGFTAAGRAGHQNQAIFPAHQGRNDVWCCQRRQRRALAGNQPQGKRNPEALQKEIGAQPNIARKRQRQIKLPLLLQLLPLLGLQQRIAQAMHLGLGQFFRTCQRL